MHGESSLKTSTESQHMAWRTGTLARGMDATEAHARGYQGLCEYSGEMKPFNALHRCPTPEVDEPIRCYACGEDADFSASQVKKGSHARCRACVDSKRSGRFAPFLQRARYGEPADLIEAVETIDLTRVLTLLEHGAQADGARQLLIRDPLLGLRAAYFEGAPVAEDDPIQPTTPLKMAVFRMSDCMLDETQRLVLLEISRALLRHGAPPAPARMLYETRYGAADEAEGAFGELYALLK